jgi:chromosome segregation ATPase
MKNIIITTLTVACLILGVALLYQHGRSLKQMENARTESLRLNGDITSLRAKADEQDKVIAKLETNVAKGKEELTAKVGELEKAMVDLGKTQTNFALAQAEVEKQAARIAELEGQRTGLTQKMEDLQGSLATLEGQILDTRKKLAASDGDRKELLAQLKRLEAEKIDLMAQFNNISALRTQLAKLKEEAAISQRLAWLRTGLYGNQEKKGAQRLLAEAAEKKAESGNRLNVEIEQNGGSKVTTPLPAPVN